MGRRLRGKRKTHLEGENKLLLQEISTSSSSLEESSNAHPPDHSVSSDSSSVIQRCDRLPHLQPITSFSSISGLSNVVLPSGVAAGTSRGNIVSNSAVIEILVHLLCREREPDHARREQLFRALCKVIKQWNSSVYLPLHAFPELQDFRASLLTKFEYLFEEVQKQITTKPANLIIPSFHLPPTGSPLTQLALADSYQHQFLDDRYSREFLEVSELGRGGFGVVVKAQNKLDGRIYAIKIIIMDKQDSETNRKLLREVQALAQLDHPNIVRYHSTWLQLFTVPAHLWPNNHGLRKLKKQQPHQRRLEKVEINQFFPASQVKIQELSSSPEPEELEESSGGIVFADVSVSRNKSNLISKKKSRCDTIHEAGESSYESKPNDDSIDDKEMSLNEKSVVNQNYKNLKYNSTHRNKDLSVESRFYNSEFSESIVTTDSSCSKINKEVSSLSHNAFISNKDIEDSVCKVKRLYTSSSSSSDSSRHYKQTLMLSRKHPKDAQMTLFIQMGICGDTLANWISKRNALPVTQGKKSHVDRKVCLDLFRQILLAVQYIHSKMIIHRDLKPPNIFFTEDRKHIQVGDFGLARSLPDAAPTEKNGIDTASNGFCLTPIISPTSNTGGVGTPIYAPPELEFGGFYGSESDMHNLGIILLELFFPFQTGSERIHVISDLKMKQYLEPEFTCQWPDIAPLILKLTDREPTKRPTASDLLKLKLFSEETLSAPISENVGCHDANSIFLTEEREHNQHYQSKELQDQFGNLKIKSNLKIVHAEEHTSIRQENDSVNLTMRNLSKENKEKDEEIRILKEENAKLQEMVTQLQEKINQSSAVE